MRWRIPGLDFRGFLFNLYQEWNRDKVSWVAGAVAFSGILALFPFLIFCISLAALFVDPAAADALVAELAAVAPPDVVRILGDRIRALAGGGSPALLTVSGLGAIWAASGAVKALIDALNTAYDVEETRPWWRTRAIALAVTVGGAALVILASAIAFATPLVARAVGGPAGALVSWARMPVAALIVLLAIALVYWALPNVKRPFELITPGAVFAAVIWVLASLGFSLYVSCFGQYEATYGALGGVVVLLLWIWISAVVVLLGAEINALLAGRCAPARVTPGPRAAPPDRAATPGSSAPSARP